MDIHIWAFPNFRVNMLKKVLLIKGLIVKLFNQVQALWIKLGFIHSGYFKFGCVLIYEVFTLNLSDVVLSFWYLMQSHNCVSHVLHKDD